jgi:hypothetical protein
MGGRIGNQGRGGKDEMRKVENWENKACGLLSLIQIVSVPSVVKWFGLYRGSFYHGWGQDGRQDWDQGRGGKR